MKIYSALSVAKYILSLQPMSHLRLQKTLYFVQVAFLLSQEEVIFKDEIEAWEYGPVVPKVYMAYKYAVGDKLTYNRKLELQLAETFKGLGVIDENIIREVDNLQKDERRYLIDEIVKELSKFTNDLQLVFKTQGYRTWKDPYNSKNVVISKYDILGYHKNILGGFNV